MWRKINTDLGLKVMYLEDENVRHLLKLSQALAFIPPEDVLKVNDIGKFVLEKVERRKGRKECEVFKEPLFAIFGQELVIFGVYMPFFNTKDKNQSISSYELVLSRLSVLIKIFDSRNIPIFIVGDFNADFFRNNPLDQILSKFSVNQNLIPLDKIQIQKIPFTFLKQVKKKDSTQANLDHILLKNSGHAIKSIQCNIVDDLGNLSDHRALYLDIFVFCENEISYSTQINKNHYKKN
ncbi:hypothetical protein BpHYR1_029767 [Brachionus plicatilis]|uniref:Endonuclease/exonuclease/phosphatase domain-containing protein n=1 Tax=Brachionus plicatilis TaxID=10195 RepID=A0A3M7S4K1_BRAPC|nr:hypothetical protein BpHYR1_029767 [Brachionus plicatilis]